MAKAVSRLYPKNRYLVAEMHEKLTAYGIQYLPLWFTDRVLLAIGAKSIPYDSVQYLKYALLIPIFATVLLTVCNACTTY